MGCKLIGFSDWEQTTTKIHIKREQLLTNMDAYIYFIEQFYSKIGSKCGRPPYPLKTMSCIHPMQQWHGLNAPAIEDILIEVPTMRLLTGTPWWACL
jgi:IS5 family transposase